jgi:hypothetical protein
MIDLCKIFGVEEGEEFKFEDSIDNKYSISGNKLVYYDKDYKKWRESSRCWRINKICDLNLEVTKLPKKKEFTDDELAIMRSLPKKYEWIARDKGNDELWLYQRKPKKNNYGNWDVNGDWYILHLFNHLFNSIQCEDEEPVFIDDYVERGAENE